MRTPPPLSSRPVAPLRPAAVLRAVVSALVLAAVVVALPILLAVATPLIWANGHDGLTHLLTRPDSSGSAFLLALLAVAWLAWAQFTLCVLAEALAQVRGRAVRPLRGFALSQRAAATLISSIVVLLPTGTALAAPATAHIHATTHLSPAPAASTTDAHNATAPSTTAEQAPAETDRQTYTEHEVQPGESLWSIAEDELGDGERWHEIAHANNGRTMPDGRTFHKDGFLQRGWKLRVPAPTHVPKSSVGPDQRSVTVRAGQTLSSIAQQQLGDATRYPELFQANRDQPQPGGQHFTNPDRIYPGQRLTLPSETSHDQPVPEPHAPHTGPPKRQAPDPAQPRHDHGHAAPAPHCSAAPNPTKTTPPRAQHGQAAAQPTQPSPSSPQPTHAAPHSATPAAPPTADSSPTADSFDLRHLAGIGALLAASITGALATRRILQQRRRQPGQTIAMPTETSRLEQALTATGEPASVQLLDQALRTLHHHVLTGDQSSLPQVRGARVTGRTVMLLPENPDEPIAPFTAGADGWWTLAAGAELLSEDEARAVPAPWPGLVTIGSNPEGDLVLLNLPHVRTVLLDGGQSAVRTVARAIAMEAATCTWSDRTEILTVGLGDDLAALLPQGRLRSVPHLRAASRDLGELLLEHHQSTANDDEMKPLPWLLICAAVAREDEAWELADAVAAARDLPIALVLSATDAASCFPQAETLNAAETAAQAFEPLSTSVVLQRVEDEDYAQLVTDLRVADEPAQPAQGPWRNVPDSATDEAGGPGELGQAKPFASLASSAGPATIHLLPPPTAKENADDEGAQDASPGIGAAGAGSVIRLVKEGSADTAAAALDVGPDLSDEAAEAPEIGVLGPVTVTGVDPSGHGPKLAALAALLYFRPGRGADALREAMSPHSPWSPNTLQARMSELRSRLGSDADGTLYLPRDRSAGYRLSPAVRCDWERFKALAERGLNLGAERGVKDLERALGLVRGRPFGGIDYPWAAPLIQEMLARITDVAHTVATWRRTGPVQDLDAARRAITLGLDVDDTAELLYRDGMRIEHASGNRAGVHQIIKTLQDVNHRLDLGIEPETEEVIKECLTDTHADVM